MSHSVEAYPVTTYLIPVRTAMKKEAESFTYTATDTIQTLNNWIHERMGIPTEQQQVLIHYGWSVLSYKKELPRQPETLLTDHLASASKVEVCLKLRSP